MDNIIKKLKKQLDSIIIAFLVVAALYGLFIGIVLVKNNFDATHFIAMGDKFTFEEQLPQAIKINNNSWGYDGQFFYRLALDPFTQSRVDYGITLDIPTLRQQRILYPSLAHFLSFGRPEFIPYVMILINYISLCMMALVSAKVAKLFNKHAWWGLLLPLYPGFFLSLARNLSEILAITLLISAYYAYKKKNYAVLLLLIILAALTRETTLIFSFGLLIFYSLRFIKSRSINKLKKIIFYSIPIFFLIIWQSVLYLVWQQHPLLASQGFNIDIPFKGLTENFLSGNLLNYLSLLEVGFLVSAIILTFYILKKSQVEKFVKISWTISFVLFSLFSANLWLDNWTYMRVFSELYFFSFIILLNSNSYIRKYILSYAMVLYLMYLYRFAIKL